MTDHTDLYVDLDGTFIKSDMLLESFIVAVKANPLIVFSSFLWLIKGRAYLKSQLANFCDLQIDTLPLNEQFHEFLKKQRADGRKIILATASNEKFAASIVQEYEIFDFFIPLLPDRRRFSPDSVPTVGFFP